MTAVAAEDPARIRVLPPEIADKIAAGEVVERPASVVKELVENSVDAGARQIRIELEDAGTGLIAVVDDGEGMSAGDAERAFARHATSKVTSAEDLFCIRTLGFRGEALASIAAVSTTTLVTRRNGDLAGTQVVVRGGKLADVRAVGAPTGTRVEVVDLFGNTPARRKFLKAPATEVGHITELVTRTALAWPQVSFSLRHGQRTLLEYPPVADAAERVTQVLGVNRAGTLLPFHGHTPTGNVHGWLSGSHVSFPSNRQVFTYVNERYVRDKLVSHAVVAGYSTLLMHGRYPAAVVFIEVPPEEVDVNVHPAKSEVRFRRGGAVHDLIRRAVSDRLREQNPAPADGIAPRPGITAAQLDLRPAGPLRLVPIPRSDDATFPPASSSALGPAEPPVAASGMPVRVPSVAAAPLAATPPAAPPPVAAPIAAMRRSVEARAPTDGFFAQLRVLGQVFEGYLVCESGDSLFLIDQHAAHERVMFERLRHAYAEGGVTRQSLLLPVVVDVGPQAAALVSEHIADLESLGFELEPFGGTSFAVRAVPALLGDGDPAALVRDLAEELTEVGRSRRLTQAAESVLARLACHSAVRVGQSLTAEQIRALLHSMDSVEFAGNCPHGRPAFITLPRSDIERLFKRT